MTRHNFTARTKREARARSGGYCEAVGEVYGLPPGQRCNAPMDGKRCEIDHYPIPATDEGSDTLENAVCCCVTCHAFKTASYDIPMQAKGKRISDRHVGIKQPSRLQSRGFEKRPPQRRASSPIVRKADRKEMMT